MHVECSIMNFRDLRAPHPATLLLLFDWCLLLAPLVTVESSHARYCDDTVELWDGRIVITRPERAVDIWLALVALSTGLAFLSEVPSEQAEMIELKGGRSRGRRLLDSIFARLSNYRVCVLTYMIIVHVTVSYGAMETCVYTTPLCFTCVELCGHLFAFSTRNGNDQSVVL